MQRKKSLSPSERKRLFEYWLKRSKYPQSYHPNANTRTRILLRLAKINYRKAIPILGNTLLYDHHSGVRVVMAHILGQTELPPETFTKVKIPKGPITNEVITYLLDALKREHHPDVVLAIENGLKNIKSPELTKELTNILLDHSSHFSSRKSAIEVLALQRNLHALPFIIHTLKNDPDEGVRHFAAMALKDFAEKLCKPSQRKVFNQAKQIFGFTQPATYGLLLYALVSKVRPRDLQVEPERYLRLFAKQAQDIKSYETLVRRLGI